MVKKLLYKNPLYVFALEIEAANDFDEMNPLFVGVGKVNAAYHLTKRIIQDKPDIIINLGSAGSNLFSKGSVVCCTGFVQRDMNATTIGCGMYETPFSGMAPILDYGLDIEGIDTGICGTGDNFEMNHSATLYNVVDMEAYPLAYIAMQEQIPFLCLKYISDGADGTAADDWIVSVRNAAKALRNVIDQIKS